MPLPLEIICGVLIATASYAIGKSFGWRKGRVQSCAVCFAGGVSHGFASGVAHGEARAIAEAVEREVDEIVKSN